MKLCWNSDVDLQLLLECTDSRGGNVDDGDGNVVLRAPAGPVVHTQGDDVITCSVICGDVETQGRAGFSDAVVRFDYHVVE